MTVLPAAFSADFGVDFGVDLGVDFGVVCFFDGAKCTQYNILVLYKLRKLIDSQLKLFTRGE